MKKLMMIIVPMLLSGCAMGINHNTAFINGKSYLIETKNYGILWSQWSGPSVFIPLDEMGIEQINQQHSLSEIKKECQNSLPARAGNKAIYECIVNKIK